MRRRRVGWLVILTAVIFALPAAAQDQRFALRFGLVLVEPSESAFNTQGGFEVDFEWYFHPRVGLEAATLGAADADVEDANDSVSGFSFSTLTVGINGHVVRSDKVDFGLGLLAGRARFTDFEFLDSSGSWDSRDDTTYGAQAFVDMTVSRKWAVDVGLKYLDAQVELGSGSELDFSPYVLRVTGVYRWGRQTTP